MNHHHEETKSGLVWLDYPIQFHGSRESKCKFDSPSMCSYLRHYWRFWYIADQVYGLSTIYFCSAIIACFAIAHWANRLASNGVRQSVSWRKARTFYRKLSYRGFYIRALGWTTPSIGVLVILTAGIVFFAGLTLGPKPYYWDNTRDGEINWGNSPPIATRAGWMAIALLPFVIVLSAKANLVSAVTGVSYEKVQVYHYWTSYAMFILALIHTFPFIVYHIWLGDMVKVWNTKIYYWTGVAALIPQAWLTLLSYRPIRNRYYEIFKSTHYIAAIFFLLFCFWHCNFILTSADYFAATFVLYFVSWVYSTFKTYALHGIRPARIEMLPCEFVKVAVDAGITTWKPGQHVFLRFLTPDLHALTAHPFTICSLNEDGSNEMVFFIKPHHGITARLARIAKQKSGGTMKVFMEGPYGGIEDSENVTEIDERIIITGGSGSGFSLPLVENLLRRNILPQNLHIIMATPSKAVAEWYRAAATELFEKYAPQNTTLYPSIDIYHSKSSSVDLNSSEEVKDDTKGAMSTQAANQMSDDEFQIGRPNLPDIIRQKTTGKPNARIGIIVCGPASMIHDVRNVAAGAQTQVGKDVNEVWLHSEYFT